MFKFLKRKLKKFEDQLEAELQQELESEISKNQPIKEDQLQTIEVDSSETPVSTEPETIKQEKATLPSSAPLESPISESSPSSEKKERLLRMERRRKRAETRKKREEEVDKQIEESIKAELHHTLQTRKNIEKIIQKERKPTWSINEEKLDDLLWELEIGLLESDVAYSVIESIKNDIKEELKYASFDRGNIGETVKEVLQHAIAHVLQSNTFNFDEFLKTTEKPIVIMFVGVNGSGKTLSIAKMATYLKKRGLTSVMAAGDTFRAGAIEQLAIHAENVGVKLIKHGPGADPAAVAYDAIEHAKAKHKDVVLLDTAGRMQTNVNLMDEMAKIKRVAKPDLILFVGDALAGNDAVEQAKRFNEIVGIDGVILTKVDTDAKGGSALSVAYTIGKPLLFIGVGQGYEDQIPFDAQWMINHIFGDEKPIAS